MVLPLHSEVGDEAAEVAFAKTFGLHHHRCRFAEQGFGVDALALADQVNVEGKQLAQRFCSVEFAKLQLLAQGRLDSDATGHSR
ncbi:hypothetical protein D3C72_1218480 [compost metagenome]